MGDLFHNYGSDLMLGPSNDLAVVGGSMYGQQRVLRRLLTAAGAYIWHLRYGGGIQQYIGQPNPSDAVKASSKAQMLLESVVAQNPAPVVTVHQNSDGTFYETITYGDSTSGTPVNLTFDLNP